jgi:hypothetical protein
MGWTLSLAESLGCPESALKLVLGQLSGKILKYSNDDIFMIFI